MKKHQKIFSKDEQDRSVLTICPNHEDCFTCKYIVQETNFNNWLKGIEMTDLDFIHYQRFTYEIRSLGNRNLLDSINETLSESYLKSSELNRRFYKSNHFGLFGFFHPHPNEFLSSCLSFEIYSITPFPENNIREINRKIRDYFFLCECDFTYGAFPIFNEKILRERQSLVSKRSTLLLKSENYSSELMDSLYSIVSAGLTPITFEDGKIDNIILNNRIQVNSPQLPSELS